MSRQRWALTAAAALIAVTVTGIVLIPPGAHSQTATASQRSTSTAIVEKRTLSATVSQAGILAYRAQADGSPYSVINQARGTYTKLPVAGQVIAQGRVLYRVDDRPVVLLRGSTPAYRTLSAGTSGPDVAELNADLVSLGYATRAELSPRSAFFGAATFAAVCKLQAAHGLTQSGSLPLGQVVFAPSAVRVTSVSAQPGAQAQPGATVVQGTSSARLVEVALSAAQQTSMKVGDRVTIALPDNRITPGVVSSVGAVATCPPSSGSGGSGSRTAASGVDSCSTGSAGSSAAPTVTVGVTPLHPAATGMWDQAPVQVGITTARVRDVLVVPVTALLARSGGGYAVEVVGAGARNRLVPVSLGLFDDAEGLVQVTGSALIPGQAVVVPSA